MTFITNTFAVAVASFAVFLGGLTFAGGAHAEQPKTFQVAIKYSRDDPASQTYTSIQTQAKSACNRQAGRSRLSNPTTRHKWVRSCADKVVGKAVAKIGKPDLMALHDKSAAALVAAR